MYKDTLTRINDAIAAAVLNYSFPEDTPGLFAPIRYTLDGGGKRMRPQLLLMAAWAVGGDWSAAVDQALGIEMFHNFTLLHDDVMDNADLRRGRPTVHRRWDSNAAILSGDTMLTLATELMMHCPDSCLRHVLDMFNTTAMQIYQGQQLDMEFENRRNVTIAEYLTMIRLKTSVLLGCACGMGAYLGGADPAACSAFYEYGVNLGLAFQLRDDWLDTYGDPIEFGKEIGGDIVNEKKTWLLITALTEEREEMEGILGEDLENAERVRQVVEVYDRLKLSSRCDQVIARYSDDALAALRDVAMSDAAREYFTRLAMDSKVRTH